MSNLNGGSRIFEGFRALGLHSSDVPHVFKYNQLRKTYLIYTAVGKVVHTYLCPKLILHRVSNQHPCNIECIAADEENIYTACENQVFGIDHSEFFKFKYVGHKHPVHILIPFDQHLISVDCESNVMIWHILTQELFLTLSFNNATFEITTALHPITYVNKMLFGSKQGTMQLWNISKNKLIFEFKNLKESPITVLEQAPAVDIVGIGNEFGDIVLLNLKLNRVVMELHQDGGPITSLSFRTDGETIMAAGNLIGFVYLWELDSKKVKGVIEHAHSSAVAATSFMHGHSLLVTNSSDNSLKVWEFEKGAGVGTLLHVQSGHVGSITKIKYYKDGLILSAGTDSTIKIFSCQGRLTKNLGQASFERKRARKRSIKLDDAKLPPVVDFAVETSRESEWDGLVAAHHRHPVATTWNLQYERMGSHKFVFNNERLQRHDSNAADGSYYVSSVACTSCGNYCLIGYNNGCVDMYNIQSGFHRGSYIDESLSEKRAAHRCNVKSIQVDALNQVTVSMALDKTIKYWKFKDKTLLDCIKLTAQPAYSMLHRASSLLAVVFDDFTFALFDVDTRKLVRHFGGHVGTINDITWSDDARWVVTCGMDCCVKTWDVPSVTLIDCFTMDDAVVSLSFSSTSDFLATAHVDDPGIYLWSNRTLYGYVNLTPLPHDFHPEISTVLPSTVAPHETEEVDAEEREYSNNKTGCDEIINENKQLSKELITLSNLPYAKWANVLQLDNIKKRNKPKEPPKAPRNAPFFLPTVSSITPQLLVEEEKIDSKIKIINPNHQLTEFATTLLNANDDYTIFMDLLKSSSLLHIDTEIRGLSPDGGGSIGLLEAFLNFVEKCVDSKRDFEIIQAYFSLFLSVHTDTLSHIEGIYDKLQIIDQKLNKDRLELSRLLNQNQCIVSFIKSATL